jgi:spermidine synthase
VITLGDYESPFGTITILKTKKSGTVIYEQGGHHQSECDCNGTSLAYYIHALFGLIWQAHAQSVLMIGCAGGTLGTMLARAGRSATIVDVNPASFPLAKLYFELPENIACHVADGQTFLSARSNTYDAVVLDAYQGNLIPPHLQSTDFHRLIRDRLNPGGVLLANVHLESDLDGGADRLAQRMSAVWPDVRILDAPDLSNRNAILLAGDVARLVRPILLVPPVIDADTIDAELAQMRFRKVHGAGE